MKVEFHLPVRILALLPVGQPSCKEKEEPVIYFQVSSNYYQIILPTPTPSKMSPVIDIFIAPTYKALLPPEHLASIQDKLLLSQSLLTSNYCGSTLLSGRAGCSTMDKSRSRLRLQSDVGEALPANYKLNF